MDPTLVSLAQQGDKGAFRAVAEASSGRLKQVAYRILRDRDLADDAVQQALIEIWRNLPRLRDPARFDAWSYRFVVRACGRESNRQRREPAAELRSPAASSGPDPVGLVHDRDELERGFEQLSVDHRAVIVMRYYLDLSVEDTATTLGVSPGTVKSRLHRATAQLREALSADRVDGRQLAPEAER